MKKEKTMSKARLVSLEAVHTHTHTHTSRLLEKNNNKLNRKIKNKKITIEA